MSKADYNKAYYQKNREQYAAYHSEYKQKNRERLRAQQREYRANLSPDQKAAISARNKERYAQRKALQAGRETISCIKKN